MVLPPAPLVARQRPAKLIHVSQTGKELGQRIAEIRRRHFGPRGKDTLAQRIGITPDDLTRFERGTIPPGEVMVSLCEATGEDLQWLLTGVASRGTVVISQARGRHQQLLARLAAALEVRPELAGPVEAFVDLLLHEPDQMQETPALNAPPIRGLIPIFEPNAGPPLLPGRDEDGEVYPLEPFYRQPAALRRATALLTEPHVSDAQPRNVTLVQLDHAGEDGPRLCLESETLTAAFPGIFGMWIRDASMQPTFEPGQAVLATPGRPSQVGMPVVTAIGDHTRLICRYWLGSDAQNNIQFGRLSDGETESYPAHDVRWTAPVQFQIKLAA